MHAETQMAVRTIEQRDQLTSKLAVIDDCLPCAGCREKLHLLNVRRKVARKINRINKELRKQFELR